MLLELGADINAVDDNGETAMHGAAYQSRSKLVELLVERGADVDTWNRKNNAGWTPLLIAEGHRPGNFRPAPETIAAVKRAMRKAGEDSPTTLENNRAPEGRTQ
jgi:ankyrin repeat protein